jgi:hypothetical protein
MRKEKYRSRRTTYEEYSSVHLDEHVEDAAEVGVQFSEEQLLANNLDQALRLHHVPGHARKAVGVDPLR